MRRRSKRQAVTMVEVLIAAGLNTVILGAAVLCMLQGSRAWIKGNASANSASSAARAVRIVSDTLREAMLVTVDANGLGLTYRMPAVENGAFTVPPVWDGVTRRIFLNGSNLVIQEGGSSRVICRNVITTDPNTGANYRIFTAGVGSVTRSVTVMVATRNTGLHNANVYQKRYRETIFLRNVPELTR
jgi:hypothetical protein